MNAVAAFGERETMFQQRGARRPLRGRREWSGASEGCWAAVPVRRGGARRAHVLRGVF